MYSGRPYLLSDTIKRGTLSRNQKNGSDPKQKYKRGLSQNLRFARGPLAEAPSPEAPSPRPQKKYRFSDSPEASSPRSAILRLARDRLATSPATTALTRLLWLDITSHQGARPLRQPHDGTVQRSGRPDVRHVSTLPSTTGLCRGYRLLCCLNSCTKDEHDVGSQNRVPVTSGPANRPLRLARDPR